MQEESPRNAHESSSASTVQLQLDSDRLQWSIQLARLAGDPQRILSLADVHIALLEDLLKRTETSPHALLLGSPDEIREGILETLLEKMSALEQLGLADQADRLGSLIEQRLDADSIASLAKYRLKAGQNCMYSGRLFDAIHHLQTAKNLFQRSKDSAGQSQVNLILIDLYSRLGDHDAALALCRKQKEAVGDHILVGWDEVIDLLRAHPADLLETATEDPSLDIKVKSLSNQLKSLSNQLKRTNEAVALLLAEIDEILARREFTSSDALFVQSSLCRIRPFLKTMESADSVERRLVKLDERMGQPRKALRRLQRVAPLHEKGMRRRVRNVLLGYEASLLNLCGDHESALEKARHALNDEGSDPSPEARWKIWREEARALAGLSRSADALVAYQAAATEIERLRRAPLGYRFDAVFLEDRFPVFDEGIHTAAVVNDPIAAFRLIQLSKGRSLAATVSVPRKPRPEPGTRELEFDEACQALDRLEAEAWRGNATHHSFVQVVEISDHRRALIDEIRRADPRWRLLSVPAITSVPMVAETVGRLDAAFLDLYRVNDAVITVAVSSSDWLITTRTLNHRTLSSIAEYNTNLRHPRSSQVQSLFDISSAMGVTIEDLIAKDALEIGLSADRLVISPHRDLHLLPWSSLLCQGRRLFEHLGVGIVPNAAVLQVVSSSRLDRSACVLVGAPDYNGLPSKEFPELPKAAQEMRRIEEIHKEAQLTATCKMHEEATESEFWRLADSAPRSGACLHVACHGLVVDDDPLLSGFVLAGGQRIDLGELALRGLPYEEVVASACSLGWRGAVARGGRLGGEEAVCMVSSLFEAGVSAIVATPHPAYDSAAADLMELYHASRVGGASPIEALRYAQLTMQEKKLWPSYKWCGFSAYGCQ